MSALINFLTINIMPIQSINPATEEIFATFDELTDEELENKLSLGDKVFKELLKKDIKTRKYFFPLTSKSTFFSKVTMPKLKNACKISVRVLCLPLYPSLKIKDVRRIIKIVNSTIKQG